METTTPSRPSADSSAFHMIDVGAKASTRRRAVAQGRIELAADAFFALQTKQNPKGDVLALAEAAGIMAAKRTSDTIPLCHPLPLSYAHVSFELDVVNSSVIVHCECATTAQTGVEMEALAGVNGALLTIYDLSKAVNPKITLSGIHLVLKEGGKSGHWTPNSPAPEVKKTLREIPAGILTISDRVSRGQATDASGPTLAQHLLQEGANLLGQRVISDEIPAIQNAVRTLIAEHQLKLLITTGGTGLSPRDVTPEALGQICTRHIDGIGELLRSSGSRHVATAWLSRSMGCVIDGALVIALPGKPSAVSEGMAALKVLLPHALHTLSGGDHGKLL